MKINASTRPAPSPLPPLPPLRWPIAALALALLGTALLLSAPLAQAAADAAVRYGGDASWIFAGAALATGVSSLGAGFAVARVGTAAVGALAEKPDLFGRLLIFIGLAEGIAIYGLIVAILMLNRV